jgi:hypothetical protein
VIRFLGSDSTQLLNVVRVLHRRLTSSLTTCCFITGLCGFGNPDNTMGDLNNEAGVTTFPIAMYVLILSYTALVLVSCADLLDVLSLTHVVKSDIGYC